MVAEFEDASLAKIMATEGVGFVVVPTAVASEAMNRYGYVSIGRSRTIETQFFAITAERRLTHPAILTIINRANTGRGKRKAD